MPIQKSIFSEISHASRIYDLKLSHLAPVDNVPRASPEWAGSWACFPPIARGPQALYEVSMSARRRYLKADLTLPERCAYRPGALKGVAPARGALDAKAVGVWAPYDGLYDLYEVKPHDLLGKLAQRFYGSARHRPSLHRANPPVEDPDRIYPRWILKVPNQPWIEPAPKAAAKGVQP